MSFFWYNPTDAIPFDEKWERDGEPRQVREGEYYICPEGGDVVLWVLPDPSEGKYQVAKKKGRDEMSIRPELPNGEGGHASE